MFFILSSPFSAPLVFLVFLYHQVIQNFAKASSMAFQIVYFVLILILILQAFLLENLILQMIFCVLAKLLIFLAYSL